MAPLPASRTSSLLRGTLILSVTFQFGRSVTDNNPWGDVDGDGGDDGDGVVDDGGMATMPTCTIRHTRGHASA
eukprot:5394928-Lingulodinium_polyedra.AAC.1